jgi:hypothetical protein
MYAPGMNCGWRKTLQANETDNKTQPEACISIYVWYNLSQEQQDM